MIKGELPTNMALFGNTLEVMKGLPSSSVHLCVTSPPYW
jgi:DNA modification methylase